MLNRLIHIAVVVVAVTISYSSNLTASEDSYPASLAISDLRVLYLFEAEESIDWPTLYYLNDRHNCRIDLVTIGAAAGMEPITQEIEGRDIFLHRYYPSPADSNSLNEVVDNLFSERRPDILILDALHSERFLKFAKILKEQKPDSNSIFNIVKTYRLAQKEDSVESSFGAVTVNTSELLDKYSDRMKLEIPLLFPWWTEDILTGLNYRRYLLEDRSVDSDLPEPDFVSGLSSLRLKSVIDSILAEGPITDSFQKRVRNFVALFSAASRLSGQRRVRSLMSGYGEVLALESQVRSEKLLRSQGEIVPYMSRLTAKAQRAVMEEIGLQWRGSIILRDSPHGPKVKFRAELSVNGPQPIELSFVRFFPYWEDSLVVNLDSISRRIKPHQSFIQEYLVEIDPPRLDAKMPESLSFSAEVVYDRFPLVFKSSVPIWEAPDVTLEFQPDFHFIQPFARLNVDKIVSSMNWKVLIQKPRHYYGTVSLSLKTPVGVFAGAYRQQIKLDKGRTQEIVRIPFSVSNLFELGIQEQIATLAIDGREVSSDTGLIRIAACKVADTIKIGFLPDSTGLLEDILRMADVTFRPLTNRSLLTGDLDAYNVIVIGSGAAREHRSLGSIKGRLEEYVRFGGSIVIFGQPGDWPVSSLPIQLNPSRELVSNAFVLNRIKGARVLSQPHKINDEDLFESLRQPQELAAAIVTPAERVYVTPTGATLLSISRIGEGQIIFCGLPLEKMIAKLNLEAIHLFSNILNY